ncbi:MAG: Uma2 family endonuclease [Planctomycetia bacterium]|nr:Uma2 family endonuclease [Planctomycetia bacterium]
MTVVTAAPIVWEFGASKRLTIPAAAHTYAGFLAWVTADDFPEKLRVTFDDGMVELDMSEEAIDSHAEVKAGVYRTLLPLVAEEDFGRLYSDGVLLCNQAAELATNPDGVAAHWKTLKAGKVTFIEFGGVKRALDGTPDWVMEIVSDSSIKKDAITLRAVYHRAGIPEYWLIDARGDTIEFQILNWRRTGYCAAPSKDGWTPSKVFGRAFRLVRKQDRLGTWLYTLEVRRDASKPKARQ